MNIPKAYTKGFIQTAKFPRMLIILYFANILLALIFALPFFSALKTSAGNSDFLNSLLEGYDYSVYSNLMYYSGKAFNVVTGGIKWLILAYFLLSVFLTGGIIKVLNDDKFSTSSFFGGGAYSFFRFLGVSLIGVLFQIVFLLLIFVPVGIYISGNFSEFQSELTVYNIVFVALGFYLLIFLLISMMGDYGKFHLELNNSFNVFKGFWGGVKYVFKHFFKTLVLYLILLIIPLIIMYVYLYLEKDIKMATGVGILLVFLMQQAFILLRVFLRTWILSSQLMVYDDDFLQLAEVETRVQSIVEQKVKEIENNKEVVSESIKTEAVVEEEAEILEKAGQEIEEDNVENEKKSAYEINFNETFSTKEENNEKIITEEDMLKKLESEEEDDDSDVKG